MDRPRRRAAAAYLEELVAVDHGLHVDVLHEALDVDRRLRVGAQDLLGLLARDEEAVHGLRVNVGASGVDGARRRHDELPPPKFPRRWSLPNPGLLPAMC